MLVPRQPVALALLAEPGRTEGVDQAPTRDHVERRRHLGEDGGMAQGVVEGVPGELDPLGQDGQRREHRPVLQHWHALVHVGIDHVVRQPDTVEA